jgi:hypothetical protein
MPPSTAAVPAENAMIAAILEQQAENQKLLQAMATSLGAIEEHLKTLNGRTLKNEQSAEANANSIFDIRLEMAKASGARQATQSWLKPIGDKLLTAAVAILLYALAGPKVAQALKLFE